MIFSLTSDQENIKESIVRFLDTFCTSERLRARSENNSTDEVLWKGINDLGLFEFFSDSELSSLVELSLFSFESGARLVWEDITTALLFGPFFSSRDLIYQSTLKDKGLSLESVQKGDIRIGFGLEREKGQIQFATQTSDALVSFHEKSRQVKFWPHTRGKLSSHPALDITSTYCGGKLEQGVTVAAAQNFIDAFYILKASELSGIASRVVKMTQEYVLVRKQFGVAVGSFQAVQQQLAEAYTKSEGLLALTQFAAWAYDRAQGQRTKGAYAAFSYALEEVPGIVETAIQLHGGIGFTWEHDLHLYLRRARLLVALFGASWEHEHVFNLM